MVAFPREREIELGHQCSGCPSNSRFRGNDTSLQRKSMRFPQIRWVDRLERPAAESSGFDRPLRPQTPGRRPRLRIASRHLPAVSAREMFRRKPGRESASSAATGNVLVSRALRPWRRPSAELPNIRPCALAMLSPFDAMHRRALVNSPAPAKAASVVGADPSPSDVDSDTEQKARDLRRMRLVATLLLAFMTLLYIAASLAMGAWPWLAYVRAFAEAAMVGACADWFAVVALFRRPFGLPIPHTGIVPTNKDRIGAALGRFMSANFLSPSMLARRLEKIDAVEFAADWLEHPGNARQVADQVSRFLPRGARRAAARSARRMARERGFARDRGRARGAARLADAGAALGARRDPGAARQRDRVRRGFADPPQGFHSRHGGAEILALHPQMGRRPARRPRDQRHAILARRNAQARPSLAPAISRARSKP